MDYGFFRPFWAYPRRIVRPIPVAVGKPFVKPYAYPVAKSYAYPVAKPYVYPVAKQFAKPGFIPAGWYGKPYWFWEEDGTGTGPDMP